MPDSIKIDDLIKTEKRKYYKNWRSKNKKRIKESNERYWKNKALKNNNINR